jgi:hypothetical protein
MISHIDINNFTMQFLFIGSLALRTDTLFTPAPEIRTGVSIYIYVGYDRKVHIFLDPTMPKLLDHALEQ